MFFSPDGSRPAALLLMVALLLAAQPASAAEWTVNVQIHSVAATDTDNGAGGQDLYRKVWIEPVVGSGAPAYCQNEDNYDLDNNLVTPGDWGCTMKISGGPDARVRIKMEVWDDDDLGNPDDELDLNKDDPAQLGLEMRFEPATSRLIIVNANPGPSDDNRCAAGRMNKTGVGGGAADAARVVFSVSASAAFAPDGDSDGDKLLDSWEVCGVHADDDGDGQPNQTLNLAQMGANPFRKDLFVELDWMVAGNHTHAPWLPALVQAWTEFDRAPVTNPTVNGIPNPSGIALHLDVGPLYANYTLDIDGAGGPDYSIGPSGNIDLDLNPGTNIVTATALPAGALPTDIGDFGGGSQLVETATLFPSGGMSPGFFNNGSTFDQIKNGSTGAGNMFARIRRGVFHYGIFSHQLALALNVGPTTVGLAEGGTANDDFTVFMAPQVANLGGLARQRVDANRDGLPDPGGAILNGPGNLTVDGTVSDHAGTLIHELGHNLGIDHGPFNIDGNPNYLSIMNVAFFGGIFYDNVGNDGIGDNAGVDYDADGIPDARRYHFSHDILPLLNEGALNETVPVSPKPSPILTRFTCPAGNGRTTRADRAVNWDCDGNTFETGANVGNRNINNWFAPLNPSALNELLPGYGDYIRLQNGGLELLPDRPSPSLEQVKEMDSRTQRIVDPLGGREWWLQRCPKEQRRLTFEEFPVDQKISAEYAPAVTFLADDRRQPAIAGPQTRNNHPTSSPDRSLVNLTNPDAPAPLSMTFGEPQRAVRVNVGHALMTLWQNDGVFAVLRAWDERGLPMGMLTQQMTQSTAGAIHTMTAVAVFPDEPIKRIELSFEIVPQRTGFDGRPQVVRGEFMFIDDLEICSRLDERGLKPFVPVPPKFGELKVSLKLESEAVHQTGVSADGNVVYARTAFSGLPVNVSGTTSNTSATLTRAEGTTLNFSAPVMHSGWRFKHWRHSSGVAYSNGQTAIPLTLLQDGTLTAVYEGRQLDDPRDPHRPPAQTPGECGCCCKCACSDQRRDSAPPAQVR